MSSCSNRLESAKTLLATALGQVARPRRYQVHFQAAPSRLDNSREALMTELCMIDLVAIDDFALDSKRSHPRPAAVRINA